MFSTKSSYTVSLIMFCFGKLDMKIFLLELMLIIVDFLKFVLFVTNVLYQQFFNHYNNNILNY